MNAGVGEISFHITHFYVFIAQKNIFLSQKITHFLARHLG